MIGTTLAAIGAHIEALASADGEYSLVCARYGDRPVPATGLRFESRAAARAAARATEQYRDALRRYDPQVPYYDVIVREEYTVVDDVGPGVHGGDATADADAGSGARRSGDGPHDVRRFSAADAANWSLSDPAVNRDRDGERRSGRGDRPNPDPDPNRVPSRDPDPNRDPSRGLVEFCHDAAAAVFEALSTADHDAVESAVMDTYFALAEERPDPDDLCLRLLEAMASELRRGLDPADQAAVLTDAASRLPAAIDGDPVAGAFGRLAGAGVVGSYASDAAGSSDLGGSVSAAVRISEYALTPRHGRFPTLPVVLELCRHGDRSLPPAAVRVTAVDGGWRLRIEAATEGAPSGLASAPIRE